MHYSQGWKMASKKLDLLKYLKIPKFRFFYDHVQLQWEHLQKYGGIGVGSGAQKNLQYHQNCER